MNFTGKVAMVTGAAAGIGRACAIEFAQYGAKLVLLDLDEEKLQGVKAELSEYTADVLIYKCDISNEARVNEVVADAQAQFGSIDILVNNAAVFRHKSEFVDTPTAVWEQYLNINVHGTVFCTKAVLPKMLENGYGKIINVASVAGVYGLAKMVHYSATKGAVIAMTKALAKEVIDKGINVNAVAPGSVSPSDNPDIDFTTESEFAKNATYIGRTGSDRENANLICFLASDAASYISGENIQIDGSRKRM